MNERQREYFRAKLLAWKDEILRGSEDDAAAAAGRERQSSRSRRPRLVRDRPRHRAARPRPPAQADLQDRRRARSASRTAPTAIARRPASRSRSSGSKRARSRRCRSRRRSATRGARRSIATNKARGYPETPDGRYFVVSGRLWRRRALIFPKIEREALTKALMSARRGIATARRPANL